MSPARYRYRRALLAFAALLILFLAIGVVVIVFHEREMFSSQKNYAMRELELVGTLSREAILKRDYATVEQFLQQWGRTHPEVYEVSAIVPNGFVLARYRGPVEPEHVFTVQYKVMQGERELVTLRMTRDFSRVRESLYRLGTVLVTGTVVLTALLGVALWFTVRKMALVPLEAEISRREEAESALRAAHDELEVRVGERTAELKAQRDMAQSYLDVAGVILLVIGRDCMVKMINKKGCEILGYGEDEIVGKDWFGNFLPLRIRNDIKAVATQLLAGEVEPVEYYENPVLTRSGEERVIAWHNVVLYDEHGKPYATLSSGEDITERKLAEERLAYSERYLRSIIENEPECVKIVSPEGKLLSVNPAGLGMMEAESPETVSGRDMLPLVSPEHRGSFREHLRKVCAGDRGVLEFEIVGLKGTHRWLESYSVPFWDEREQKTFMLSLSRDVTERRRLEEQLHQARKLEAIGTLTGGIAHDFNNILSAIIGFGESVEMDMTKEDPLRPYLEQILDAAEKGTMLTHGLLAFSRKLVIKPRPVFLNNVVKSSEKLIMRLTGDDIRLITDLSPENITVMADAAHLEQVLVNLATNARDAMPGGGVLTIRTSAAEMDDNFIAAYGFGKPGAYGLIGVTDTGEGMDEETRQRIFEPFYTTKKKGLGTGLGLSMVYGTIKQHGGFVVVYSKPGRGTTFNIYLPAVGLKVRERASKDLEPPRGGTECVLVAEDDAGVRMVTKNVLEKFGYKVIEAADGAEAVEAFRDNSDRVHLLLFDVLMPTMNGKEAYDEIRKIRPGVKVLFTSGYIADMVQREIIAAGLDFVSKPIALKELLRKVRQVLDAPAPMRG